MAGVQSVCSTKTQTPRYWARYCLQPGLFRILFLFYRPGARRLFSGELLEDLQLLGGEEHLQGLGRTDLDALHGSRCTCPIE